MFKFNNKDTRRMSLRSFWCLYYQCGTQLTPFFSVEQVNVCWVDVGRWYDKILSFYYGLFFVICHDMLQVFQVVVVLIFVRNTKH